MSSSLTRALSRAWTPRAVASAIALTAGFVHAEPSPDPRANTAAKVEVRLWVDPLVPLTSVERLRADLEAGLLNRGSVTLVQTDSPAPGATTVSVRKGERSTVLVSVFERTGKRATREVDLSAVPEDGRELTVAVIADELISALSETSPDPKPIAIPAPQNTQARAPRDRPTPSKSPKQEQYVRIALGPIGSTFSGGTSFVGGGVGLGWESRRIVLDGLFGYERALPAEFPEGTVHGELWSGELGVSLDLLPQPSWSLGPRGALRVGRVSLLGEASEGAQGHAVSGLLVVPRAGLDLGYRTGSFRLLARIGVGATLASVIASINDEPALSASGVEGWFGVSAGGAF